MSLTTPASSSGSPNAWRPSAGCLRGPASGWARPPSVPSWSCSWSTRAARPLPQNQAVLRRGRRSPGHPGVGPVQPGVQPTPTPLAGRPFTALGEELRGRWNRVAAAAGHQRGGWRWSASCPRCAAPDLHRRGHHRSAPLSGAHHGLPPAQRQAPFRDRASAAATPTRWEVVRDDVALEGANTSFQVHLRVDPAAFTPSYNAAQLATAPVLAAAGNSPTFLASVLWEETRIALFKQSVDDREAPGGGGWPPGSPSAPAGCGGGPRRCSRRRAPLHQPLLPVLGDQDPLLALGRRGRCPAWTSCGCTRARCGAGTGLRPGSGGHVRIEMRRPARRADGDRHAGQRRVPARAALGLAAGCRRWTTRLPFARAEQLLPGPPSTAWRPSWSGRGPRPPARPPRRRAGARLLPGPARRAGRGRGRGRRGRPAARGDRRPGGQRTDRRRVAAPGAGRPGGRGVVASARWRSCCSATWSWPPPISRSTPGGPTPEQAACGHQPHRRPGPPHPPGQLDPSSLGHRGVAPPPRCHLRRGRNRPRDDIWPAPPRMALDQGSWFYGPPWASALRWTRQHGTTPKPCHAITVSRRAACRWSCQARVKRPWRRGRFRDDAAAWRYAMNHLLAAAGSWLAARAEGRKWIPPTKR